MAKSKYESHVKPKLFLIECWARDGLRDEDICDKLGISVQSFYVYKSKYGEFSESLKRGKEVIDFEVENALLKRALGYEYEETKIYIDKDANGKERTRKEKIKKVQPPDTLAQIFWLKNRKPAQWRDKQELNHNLNTKNIKINVDIEGVEDE